jgi:hypothetical protein
MKGQSELIANAEGLEAKDKKLKAEKDAVMSANKAVYKELVEFSQRVRSGAKVAFGADSLEYERVGGKRTSNRKKASKKSDPKAA